ncbi:hypothetical protein GEMRC1_013958 [Eukaryota sp. GEM-RC1]
MTKIVGPNGIVKSFVDQFFSTLAKSPERVMFFFGKEASLTVSEFGASFSSEIHTGRTEIRDYVVSSVFLDKAVYISSVDFSPFDDDSILVVANGTLVQSRSIFRTFQNTFILSRVADPTNLNWYYVKTAIFRWMSELPSFFDVPAPATLHQTVESPAEGPVSFTEEEQTAQELERVSKEVEQLPQESEPSSKPSPKQAKPKHKKERSEPKPKRERSETSDGTPRPRDVVVAAKNHTMRDLDKALRDNNLRCDIAASSKANFTLTFYNPHDAETLLQNGLLINGEVCEVKNVNAKRR